MADILIAGPILRRVTPGLVCVWMATEKKLTLKLTILRDGQSVGASDSDDEAIINQQRCQLGKKLFVYLLQAKPDKAIQQYPYDELLSYRIDDITGSTPKAINLKALKLTYDNAANPTFFIPKFLNRLLHGSCRKPHGHVSSNDTHYDALSAADDELNLSHNDLTNRPALLLMTGDQIYADDVAKSVFNLVSQKGPGLLGFKELLPQPLKPGGKDPNAEQPDGRTTLAKENAGFSSESVENHLFRFSEFAAMYVYVYGNALNWSPDFSQESNADVRNALQAFHSTLPNVRRLFANIPTYMIFDDHDVTDDWNITGGWYDRVRDKPLGHRVVSNALAAYWAFQGWGNEPDNFDYDMIRAVIDFLATDSPSETLTRQYDFTTWKHRGWGYSLPTNPPVIFLDSRTQRVPDGNFYPAQLMDRYALDWLIMEWFQLKAQKELEIGQKMIEGKYLESPIIIAATPVMGFTPVEWLTQLGLWLLGAIEDSMFIRPLEKIAGLEGVLTGYFVNKYDAESWISNREGFSNFLNCLLHKMAITQCVFLSGDVHYAFTVIASFQSMGKKLDCWQLTSSSLCNEPNEQQEKAIDKFSRKQEFPAPKNWALLADNRWETAVKFVADADTGHKVISQCNIGLVELKEGKPIRHTLICDKDRKVFALD